MLASGIRPLLLWAALPLRPLPPAARHVFMSEAPRVESSQLVPKVDEALLAQVKQDIWRTSTASDASALAREQTEAVETVLAKVEALISKVAAADGASGAPADSAPQLAALLTEDSLNAVIAPHLPLLTMRGYPEAARSALSKVRTVEQQAALFTLTQYMSGVYEEMAKKLGDLQWQQLNKLRELCESNATAAHRRVSLTMTRPTTPPSP